MRGRNIELDVLQAVMDHGAIADYFADGPSEALQRLRFLYPAGPAYERVAVTIEFLKTSGHLWRYEDHHGKDIGGFARGLTPQGERRLYELEHSTRVWLRINWLRLATVASATFLGLVTLILQAFLIENSLMACLAWTLVLMVFLGALSWPIARNPKPHLLAGWFAVVVLALLFVPRLWCGGSG